MDPIDFKALAAPFDPADLDWRIGQKSRDGRKATVLAYVTSRAVQARLDAIVGPDRWRDSYVPLHDGGKVVGFLATLEIQVAPGEWVGKTDASDTSDIEAIKGGVSGALKRVAVKWGVGRYLYDLDTRYLPIQEGYGADGDIHCAQSDGSVGHVKRPVLPLWALPTRVTGKPAAQPQPQPDPPSPTPPRGEPSVEELRSRVVALERTLGPDGVAAVRRSVPAEPRSASELTAYGKALRAAVEARAAHARAFGGDTPPSDKAA